MEGAVGGSVLEVSEEVWEIPVPDELEDPGLPEELCPYGAKRGWHVTLDDKPFLTA